MKSLKLLVAGVLVLGACAGDTAADVEGTYTVATTNRDDACNLGWVVGQTNSGIMVVITQNGGSAVAEVKGLTVGCSPGKAVHFVHVPWSTRITEPS